MTGMLVREKATAPDREFIQRLQQISDLPRTQRDIIWNMEESAKTTQALDELGIKPFTPEGVRKYKSRAAMKATLRVARWPMMLMLAGIVSIFVGSSAMAVFGSIMVVIGAIASGVILGNHATWTLGPVSSYDAPIPYFALDTLANVSAALKQHRITHYFHIDRLRSVGEILSEASSRPADPFLVLEVGKTRFYLEVWAEPKFDAERMA